MKRIWIFVLLAVLWCGLAFVVSGITGDSIYLAWAIFLPPSLLLINAARPRRGLHYVYWNRYIYVFGALILGMIGVPFLVGYLSWPIKIFGVIFEKFFVPWSIGFPAAWFLWFKFYFMPAWGDWRLRRRYPRMVAAARRLKKFSEHYTWYIPLISVQGRPYIVVGYEIQGLTGIATLDEEGRFVKDEKLVETLIRCYKLAVDVLHMPDNLSRAKEIDSFKQTDRQMQGYFRRFRENEAYFLAAGKQAYDLWKNICDFEQDFHTIARTLIERKTWQAQWAYEHGLNRLTEVNDEQLRQVEARLAEFGTVLRNYTAKIDQVSTEAEVLQRALPKLLDLPLKAGGKPVRLKHRSTIQDMLKGLIVFRQAAVAWQNTVVDFLPLEREWKVWREREAMAERLEQERAI